MIRRFVFQTVCTAVFVTTHIYAQNSCDRWIPLSIGDLFAVIKTETPLSPGHFRKIFIIGDSTVHRHNINGGETTEGWGDELHRYLFAPESVDNRARAGSSAETYREVDEYYGADRYWGETEERMHVSEGCQYLLIQFGSSNEQRFYDARYPRLDENGNVIDYNGDGVGDEADEEERERLIKRDFQNALLFYIEKAQQELNAIPILLSPPNAKFPYSTRGSFPDYIEALANEKKIAYLDLHQQSLDVFGEYTHDELIGLFGLHRPDGTIDNTHYNVQGAFIVAGWVRELACRNDKSKSLCSMFKPDVRPLFVYAGEDQNVTQGESVSFHATAYEYGKEHFSYRWEEHGVLLSREQTFEKDDFAVGTHQVTLTVHDDEGQSSTATVAVQVTDAEEHVTVYEDAEDGNTDRWGTYGDGAGSVANVADDEKGGRVIALSGNGLDSGYSFTNLNITEGFVVSWAMKYSETFRFFVKVQTQDHGVVYMTYVPEAIDRGYVEENGKSYVYLALGTDADDGTWHDFSRDIVADLHKVKETYTITSIIGFYIRGSGRVDDIATSTRGSYAQFTYNGHHYKIVKSAKSWQEASDDAATQNGYLVHIDSKAENEEVYSRLYRYITDADYDQTRAPDGGNAVYVWIGGSDHESEGAWRWSNDNLLFSQGNTPQPGIFTNWGQAWDAAESTEPDDWTNTDLAPQGQDFAAMALYNPPHADSDLGNGRDWPWGLAGQWNDVAIGDQFYYIIEYDQ